MDPGIPPSPLERGRALVFQKKRPKNSCFQGFGTCEKGVKRGCKRGAKRGAIRAFCGHDSAKFLLATLAVLRKYFSGKLYRMPTWVGRGCGHGATMGNRDVFATVNGVAIVRPKSPQNALLGPLFAPLLHPLFTPFSHVANL